MVKHKWIQQNFNIELYISQYFSYCYLNIVINVRLISLMYQYLILYFQNIKQILQNFIEKYSKKKLHYILSHFQIRFLNKFEKKRRPYDAVACNSLFVYFFLRSIVYAPAVSFLYLVFSSFRLLALLVYFVWEFLFVLASTCVIFSDIFAVFLLIYTTIGPFLHYFFSIHFFLSWLHYYSILLCLINVIYTYSIYIVIYTFPVPIPRIRFLILSYHMYI